MRVFFTIVTSLFLLGVSLGEESNDALAVFEKNWNEGKVSFVRLYKIEGREMFLCKQYPFSHETKTRRPYNGINGGGFFVHISYRGGDAGLMKYLPKETSVFKVVPFTEEMTFLSLSKLIGMMEENEGQKKSGKAKGSERRKGSGKGKGVSNCLSEKSSSE